MCGESVQVGRFRLPINSQPDTVKISRGRYIGEQARFVDYNNRECVLKIWLCWCHDMIQENGFIWKCENCITDFFKAVKTALHLGSLLTDCLTQRYRLGQSAITQ